jgi:hypothetical protein
VGRRAGVVESVDTPALGAGGASHGGSSPSARIVFAQVGTLRGYSTSYRVGRSGLLASGLMVWLVEIMWRVDGEIGAGAEAFSDLGELADGIRDVIAVGLVLDGKA